MATQLRIEKKRLNALIKKYKKCIIHYKNIGAHPYNINRMIETLNKLELLKTELLTKKL